MIILFEKFSNTLLQNDVMSALPRQPCNNLENLHVLLHDVEIKIRQCSRGMLQQIS